MVNGRVGGPPRIRNSTELSVSGSLSKPPCVLLREMLPWSLLEAGHHDGRADRRSAARTARRARGRGVRYVSIPSSGVSRRPSKALLTR